MIRVGDGVGACLSIRHAYIMVQQLSDHLVVLDIHLDVFVCIFFCVF